MYLLLYLFTLSFIVDFVDPDSIHLTKAGRAHLPPFKGKLGLYMYVCSSLYIIPCCMCTSLLSHYLPHQGKPKCLPQLAWHYVVIEHRSAGGKNYSSVDPVRFTGTYTIKEYE
jgi:hypothetical protein